MVTLEDQVKDLLRRVGALEEALFRTHRTRQCMQRVIQSWPGPFTAQQIEDALKEFHPDVFTELKPYAVLQLVRKFERAGSVERVSEGRGCVAALFRVTRELPDPKRRPGQGRNRRAEYESGFRHMVRTALGDLPEEFTLEDLRKWMAEHMPNASIPYGSWSSTLYKLTQSQELICVKGRGTNCSAKRKVWTRGPVKVAPSGDEMRETEAAWAEFRRKMKQETAVA